MMILEEKKQTDFRGAISEYVVEMDIPFSNRKEKVIVATEIAHKEKDQVVIQRQYTYSRNKKKIYAEEISVFQNGVLRKEEGKNHLEYTDYKRRFDESGREHGKHVKRQYSSQSGELVNTITKKYDHGTLVSQTDLWPNGQKLIHEYDIRRNESGPWRSTMIAPLEGGIEKVEIKHYYKDRLEGLEYTYTTDGSVEEVIYNSYNGIDEKKTRTAQRQLRWLQYRDNVAGIVFDSRKPEEIVVARANHMLKKHHHKPLMLA